MVFPALAGLTATTPTGPGEYAPDWLSGASELAIAWLIDNAKTVAASTEKLLLMIMRSPLS
jgi:hypothetical protein